MAANNEVTLTFAGDSKKLEDAFDRVGGAAKDMDEKVDKASRNTKESFDKAAEGFDTADTRAMGFRDTITGVQDTSKAFGDFLKGDFSGQALLTAGMGIGDLASGFANLIVPMAKTIGTTVASTAAMVAHATWSGIVRVATLAWTGVQWLLNAALLASPLTWIVLAIVALVAVIVIIATKTDWFQRLWKVAWGAIKKAAGAVADWFKGPFVNFFKGAWDKITAMPGKLKEAFGKVKDFILAPFKAAFNAIAGAWNNTVGRLSFHIPGWVPGLGGKGFSMPNIPTFHSGGVVPGAPGSEVLAILQAGERVTPRGGGDAVAVQLHISGEGTFASMFLEAVRTQKIRLSVSGGRVAVAGG